MKTFLSATCLTSFTGCVHVSLRTRASMEPLCMSIVLVNESGYGQLGKWNRCLIFSFSSVDWLTLGYYTQISTVKWQFFFLSLALCQVWNKASTNPSPSFIPKHLSTHTHTHTHTRIVCHLTFGWRCEPFHADSYYQANLCVYWVCSTSSPKRPQLRYPCHVTPKDSQRSGSEGTEGPQMELHRVALPCPSAVTSPRA